MHIMFGFMYINWTNLDCFSGCHLAVALDPTRALEMTDCGTRFGPSKSIHCVLLLDRRTKY